MTTLAAAQVSALAEFTDSAPQALRDLSEADLLLLVEVPASDRAAYGVLLERGLINVNFPDPDLVAGVRVMSDTYDSLPGRLDELMSREGVEGLRRVGRQGAAVVDVSEPVDRTVNALWLAAGFDPALLPALSPEHRQTLRRLSGDRNAWVAVAGPDVVMALAIRLSSRKEEAAIGAGTLLDAGAWPADVVALDDDALQAAYRMGVYTYHSEQGLADMDPDLLIIFTTVASRTCTQVVGSGNSETANHYYSGLMSLVRAGMDPEVAMELTFTQVMTASFITQNNGTGLRPLIDRVGMADLPALLNALALRVFELSDRLGPVDLDNLDKEVAYGYHSDYFALSNVMGGGGRLIGAGVPAQAVLAMDSRTLSLGKDLGEGNGNGLAPLVQHWTPEGTGPSIENIYGQMQGLSHLVAAGVDPQVALSLSRTAWDRAFRAGPAMYSGPATLKALPHDLVSLEATLSALPEDVIEAYDTAVALALGFGMEEALELATDPAFKTFVLRADQLLENLPEGASTRRMTRAAMAAPDPYACAQLITSGVDTSLVLGVPPVTHTRKPTGPATRTQGPTSP